MTQQEFDDTYQSAEYVKQIEVKNMRGAKVIIEVYTAKGQLFHKMTWKAPSNPGRIALVEAVAKKDN